MGWKNFSKLFEPTREVAISDMAGQLIAVDAMTEIYRAALATKSVSTLTDKYGAPTIHISVVISTVMDFMSNGVRQIWVFDHNQAPDKEFHNVAKMPELAKRKAKKDKAIEDLKELFSDDESDTEQPAKSGKMPADDDKINDANENNSDEEVEVVKKSTVKNLKVKKRNMLEKQAFTVSPKMIADVKFILDKLGIYHIDAPEGFEAEGIASYLNKIGIVDAVFSGDTDAIAYGAKRLYRRVPIKKVILEYTYDDIIEQVIEKNSDIENPDIDLLIKCALVMGTDFCEKTHRIGPGTVLKRIEYIELTDEQEKAMVEFTKTPNISVQIEARPTNVPGLIEWLVNERQFNEDRMIKKLDLEIIALANERQVSKKSKSANPVKSPKSASANPAKSPKSPKASGAKLKQKNTGTKQAPRVIRRAIITTK
jgi:flap endonuclease-1